MIVKILLDNLQQMHHLLMLAHFCYRSIKIISFLLYFLQVENFFKTEQRYSQTDWDALSIIVAVNKCEKFILGRKLVLRTNHHLIHIFNPSSSVNKTANTRLVRWSLLMSSFQYHIAFIAGTKNNKANLTLLNFKLL